MIKYHKLTNCVDINQERCLLKYFSNSNLQKKKNNQTKPHQTNHNTFNYVSYRKRGLSSEMSSYGSNNWRKSRTHFVMLQTLSSWKIYLSHQFTYHSCPHHYYPHSQLDHHIFWMPGRTSQNGTWSGWVSILSMTRNREKQDSMSCKFKHHMHTCLSLWQFWRGKWQQ